MTCVEKLLSISSEPLASSIPDDWAMLEGYPLGQELRGLLRRKNGFYAFESALHVFPLTSDATAEMDLEQWNSDSLWRREYQDLATGLLFFAEDLFQDQFCLSAHGVLRFKAETGETTLVADSIEKWAGILLNDYDYETAWPLARKWQVEHGPLPAGKRLMPTTPFFLGGAYLLENLWAGNSVEGMRFKADVAIQTRNLPDGTPVRLVVGRKPDRDTP
jgi:hypothetical protein